MPRAFLAHSFHDADRELVASTHTYLRERLGYEVVTGESGEPREVSEKIRDRIDGSDVLVAILTPYRRDQEAGPRPSPWTVSELNYAYARGLPCIVLLAKGIPRAEIGGLLADLETVEIDEGRVDRALEKVAEMARWAREHRDRRIDEERLALRRDRANRLRNAYKTVVKSALALRDLTGEMRVLRDGETWVEKVGVIDERAYALRKDAEDALVALRLETGTDEVVTAYYGVWNGFVLYRLDVSELHRRSGSVPPEEVRKDRELVERNAETIETAAREHLRKLES